MKKTLLALAALTAFAGTASAQSSVTLSGSLDAGLRRVGIASGTTTKSDWRVAGSQSGYNAFTLSGVEDLGGGTRAFFSLNHRFTIGNGAVNGTTNAGGTTPFWRNTAVGLGGGFGDFRIGRFLMPLQDLDGSFDAFNTGTVGTVHTGGLASTIRANNTISYRSPSLGGLSVHASVAAAEGQTLDEVGFSAASILAPTSKLNAERPIGFNVRYKAGPVDAGVAYDKNTADMKTIGVYGAYDFGAAKVMFQFEKGDNFTLATAPATAVPNEDLKALSIGLTAPLGPVILRTGVLKIKSDLTNRDASKFGLGGDYVLSKRTNLYTTVGKWSGNRISTANKKAQFDFGVTHRF